MRMSYLYDENSCMWKEGLDSLYWNKPLDCLNVKMPSYQYRNSYHKDKMVSRPSHLHAGESLHLARKDSLYIEIGPGSHLNIKMSSNQYRISMLKIRRSHDRLIFNMGIPKPGKTVFILKQGPGPPYRIFRFSQWCMRDWVLALFPLQVSPWPEGWHSPKHPRRSLDVSASSPRRHSVQAITSLHLLNGNVSPRSRSPSQPCCLDVHDNYVIMDKSILKVHLPNGGFNVVKCGDATDVRDIVHLVVGRLAEGHRNYQEAYALRLVHHPTQEFFWLHNDLTMYQVRQKYESLHPPEECR